MQNNTSSPHGWFNYRVLIVGLILVFAVSMYLFTITHDKNLFSFIHDKILEKRWANFDATKIAEPIQVPYEQNGPIIKVYDGDKFSIIPVAKYKVSVLVVSKKFYNDDKPSPIDIVFLWGKIADPHYTDYLEISQHDRIVKYNYKLDSPYSKSYIDSHGSNAHIIPANDNIFSGLKTIYNNQIVHMEGYLVNVEGPKGTWKTSLSRRDTGIGSCEIFYVKKLKLNNQTYE